MTREDEINQSLKKYSSEKIRRNAEEFSRIIARQAYTDGARFADRHPSFNTIRKILEIYDGASEDEIELQTLTDATEYVKEHFND